METDVMVGFGGKQAWLAVRAGDPETSSAGSAAILAALGLRDLGTVRWRDGIDLAHLSDDRVAVTPPIDGWTLAVGRYLMQAPLDLPGLSATLDAEVQFFATHRVSEWHRWQKAAGGLLIRAFGYVGQTGEVTSWFGDPDPAEPLTAYDEDTTVLVAEQDVFAVAAAWSIDPTTLDGRPAPGPIRMGAADA
ncbi:hypothetical protein AB0M20_22560 [Actinoplanes sp. NPDC051633]|uniref:hypothetical protein n=1 Tax=Actinoplanes sp. NPDC051633 TaxID=3155670 RepID=UPI00343DA9E6